MRGPAATWRRGHGGILGGLAATTALLLYLPATRHTTSRTSNITKLPASAKAVRAGAKASSAWRSTIKDANGQAHRQRHPVGVDRQDGGYAAEDFSAIPRGRVDLIALVDTKLKLGRLAGFVLEGLTPFTAPCRRTSGRRSCSTQSQRLPVARVGAVTPKVSPDRRRHFPSPAPT